MEGQPCRKTPIHGHNGCLNAGAFVVPAAWFGSFYCVRDESAANKAQVNEKRIMRCTFI